MTKCRSRVVLRFLFAIVCISLAYGNNMGPECNTLKEIQLHYKNYYDMYLGENPFTRVLSEEGLFVMVLKQTVKECCSTAKITYHKLQTHMDDKAIEEFLLDAMKADRSNANNGIVKLFGPEYAYKKVQHVYDLQVPFLGLFRSPGPALIMKKRTAKEPVFVGDIFLKSWAIIIFLISAAFIFGVLVWVLVSSRCFCLFVCFLSL